MDNVKNIWRKETLQKWLPVLLFALMALIRVFFLNKGIDYTDTGYNIAKYKYVFYGEGISDIGMFYTDLIGGLLYYVLPAYQLLAYRILHLVIWLATAFFAYQIFKRYTNRTWLLVFFVGLATLVGGEMIYSYYPLSQLLLLLSVWLLHDGLIKDNKWLLFAAGFASCINVFARLTNLLYLSMILGILWYGWCKGQGKKKIAKDTGIFFGGVVAGGVFTLLLMLVFMGFHQIWQSFLSYAGVLLGQSGTNVENFLGVQETSGHSLFAEIITIGKQGVQAIIIFVCFFVLLSLVAYGIQKLFAKFGKTENSTRVAQILILLIWIVAAVVFAKELANRNLYILGLAAIVLCILLMFQNRKEQPAISMLCLLTVLLSVFSVVGTDKGLQRFFIVRTMQVPMLLICAQQIPLYWERFLEKVRLKKLKGVVTASFVKNWLQGFCILMCISIFATGFFTCMQTAYSDAAYSELTYICSEEILPLKGMYTSKARAEALDEYYTIMNADALQDKEVAVFGYFPLGLVIGSQQDYFERVDPCVDYPRFSVEMLLEVIQEKEQEGVVPVIVLSHVDRIQRGRAEEEGITSEAKQAVIDYMLTLHDYAVYAETEYYTIYVANT